MDIAIPIYDRFTALDAVGPYEVLLPAARRQGHVRRRASRARCRPRPGCSRSMAETSFADLPNPEVIVVPGGFGNRELLEESGLVDWIRSAHETTQLDDLGLHRLAAAGGGRRARRRRGHDALAGARRAARARRRARSRTASSSAAR